MRTFTSTIAAFLAALSFSESLAAARPSDLAARDPLWDAILSLNVIGNPGNDFKCKSTAHPNPVVLIHALSANPSIDLNLIQRDMEDQGYCTYATTYGAHTLAPWIGGLKDMRESSQTLADFVMEVVQKTGAPKVDLVGHSEGGVMSLYVPMKYPQVAAHVEHIVALGPAVHGAQYFGLTQLFYEGGQFSRDLAAKMLHFLGCPACDDMATGGNIFNDFKSAQGKIVQAGNKATIIMSRNDTLVAPDVSRVDEPGVRNIFIQDSCPQDAVGHAGLAWDTGVWSLVYNALNEDYDAPVSCEQGLPA